MIRSYPHILARMFGVPLLVEPGKAKTIAEGFGPRLLGLDPWPTGGIVGIDPSALVGETPGESILPVHASHPRSHFAERGYYSLSDEGVATIPITGSLVHRGAWLGESSGQTAYMALQRQVEAAISDPAVQAIVLDVDSYGGEAEGAFALAEVIRAADKVKPVISIANGAAASGGYALAAAARRMLVTQTAVTGSIGAIILHVDQTERDAKDGLKYSLIRAGEKKALANSHEALSDSARDELQAAVDAVRMIFAAQVATHRRMPLTKVLATEAGLFNGAEAVAQGFADGVGTLATARSLAVKEARMSSGIGGSPSSKGASRMDNQTEQAPGNVVDIDAARAGERATSLEIIDLCTLAGMPERAAEYIRAGTPIGTIRGELLRLRAERDRIQTDTAAPPPKPITRLSAAEVYAARARAMTNGSALSA